MNRRMKIIITIILINFVILIAAHFYIEKLNDIVVNDTSSQDTKKPIQKTVTIEGIYKIMSDSLINATVDFKEGGTSLWIVKLDSTLDTIPKKFEINGEQLIVTNDSTQINSELIDR